ncbi:MAG: histidine phosphatase family protein [Candidatus Dormibacteraeota bacterium]|nr:histidine phosphatase family protein [Candidatus Dormibacteraeota bacterium]
MPETSRIFLCRHAAPANPTGVFYGHLPGFGLGKTGRRQALGLGRFLAAYPVCKIFTSPLDRARETAELVASRLPRKVDIEVRNDLVEAEFGKYLQGVKRPEALFRRPLFLVHAVAPGALPFDEKVAQMAERVGRVVREALETCRGQAAAIVSHADPIKALWNQELGRADWRFHFLDLPKGGFIELQYEGDELARIIPHGPVLDAEAEQPAA